MVTVQHQRSAELNPAWNETNQLTLDWKRTVWPYAPSHLASSISGIDSHALNNRRMKKLMYILLAWLPPGQFIVDREKRQFTINFGDGVCCCCCLVRRLPRIWFPPRVIFGNGIVLDSLYRSRRETAPTTMVNNKTSEPQLGCLF